MTNDKITVSRELLRQTIDLLDDMLAPGATFSTASLRAAVEQTAVEQTAVEPVAWVWNPAKESWERVHVFGHWQSGAIYAFGPEAPQPQQPAVEPEAWYDGRKFYATPSAAHRRPLNEEPPMAAQL